MSTDRYPGPIGRLSQCAANGARSLLTTITFLGERQDIFDPEAAVLVAGQTTERQCSVRQQPDSQQPLGAEDVVESHLGKVVFLIFVVDPSPPPCGSVHPVSTPSTPSAPCSRAVYYGSPR